MKFRVMVKGGITREVVDFGPRQEQKAREYYGAQKITVSKMKTVGAVRPSVTLHRCYHDEGKSCPKPIERFEK